MTRRRGKRRRRRREGRGCVAKTWLATSARTLPLSAARMILPSGDTATPAGRYALDPACPMLALAPAPPDAAPSSSPPMIVLTDPSSSEMLRTRKLL